MIGEDEIQAWIQNTNQNNPNLTTLFFPNGVLES